MCLTWLRIVALQALGEAAAAQGTFAAVQRLFKDYLKAERAHSAITALCLPPAGAQTAPLLIRRGPVLSCLQPAEPVTALVEGASAPGHHASSQVRKRPAPSEHGAGLYSFRRRPVLSCLQPAEAVPMLAQSACAPGHHARSLVNPLTSTLGLW